MCLPEESDCLVKKLEATMCYEQKMAEVIEAEKRGELCYLMTLPVLLTNRPSIGCNTDMGPLVHGIKPSKIASIF